MPTHAELTAKLLMDAATFFKTLAEQNEPIKDQMLENAGVFEQMSALIHKDPQGVINDQTHGQLSGKLLHDAAEFFKTLAEENEPIKDQMLENAKIFEEIGHLVAEDPQGVID